MVELILGRMDKNKWKIGEKMGKRGVWSKGRRGEKNGGAGRLFSFRVYQNSIFPKWGENMGESEAHNFGLKCLYLPTLQRFFFFFIFYFFIFRSCFLPLPTLTTFKPYSFLSFFSSVLVFLVYFKLNMLKLKIT